WEIRLECFRHDSQNLHTSPFFFKQIQQNGEEFSDGLLGAPCIQTGSFNCPVEYGEEMHAGYVQQRMPAQCDTGSRIGTRKLNSVAGWAKHAILYEFASLEGFNRDYAAANAKSPLGLRGHSIVSMLIHAPSGPNSALRSWS